MRPFYLAAGAYAAIAMLLWVASLAGVWNSPINDPRWHAHEMIFGYALAVVTGFLFTAVRNWTRQATPTGMHLAGIVSLWLAARLLLMVSPLWSAVADLAFALAVIHGIARPMLRAKALQHLPFVAVLTGIGASNVLFHLAMAGVLNVPVSRGLQTALDLVLFLMVLLGGRVIPSFTANVTGMPPRRNLWVERTALAAVLGFFVVDAIGIIGMPLLFLAALALVAHGVRFLLWRPWTTRKTPLLWILHGAYLFVVIHFALRGLAAIGLVNGSLATHALTVGGLGGLTLGMMTRTARGHTGWPLQAGAMEIAAYGLVFAAAAARVFVPILFPPAYGIAIIGSGFLWAAAFTLFVVRYWPILSGPDQR